MRTEAERTRLPRALRFFALKEMFAKGPEDQAVFLETLAENLLHGGDRGGRSFEQIAAAIRHARAMAQVAEVYLLGRIMATRGTPANSLGRIPSPEDCLSIAESLGLAGEATGSLSEDHRRFLDHHLTGAMAELAEAMIDLLGDRDRAGDMRDPWEATPAEAYELIEGPLRKYHRQAQTTVFEGGKTGHLVVLLEVPLTGEMIKVIMAPRDADRAGTADLGGEHDVKKS